MGNFRFIVEIATVYVFGFIMRVLLHMPLKHKLVVCCITSNTTRRPSLTHHINAFFFFFFFIFYKLMRWSRDRFASYIINEFIPLVFFSVALLCYRFCFCCFVIGARTLLHTNRKFKANKIEIYHIFASCNIILHPEIEWDHIVVTTSFSYTNNCVRNEFTGAKTISNWKNKNPLYVAA